MKIDKENIFIVEDGFEVFYGTLTPYVVTDMIGIRLGDNVYCTKKWLEKYIEQK